MTTPSRIIGAGLSGLLAAHAWPNVPIVEASKEPKAHRALLRFRSKSVAELTGIEFKKVLVRKGLWSYGAFRQPTIALANAYSQKVLNLIIGDRSVWNLDAVERWIAPDDFQERLLAHVKSRVTFGQPDDMQGAQPFISTAPMPVALNTLDIALSNVQFIRAAIEVTRYKVPRCDAHQTVYFPDPDVGVYRASITGDVLIVESVINKTQAELALGIDRPWAMQLNAAFGIHLDECQPLGQVNQEFGKIVNLPDATRRALLFKLTTEHGLYSLGRFATWRNVLLDDVVNDIHVIKRLMATDRYELRQVAS
jgi:hypothetical protein